MGQDMDSVVRLCLEQLNAPQRACSIIRETRSADGAREIAKYSQVNKPRIVQAIPLS